jgi:hypothetical protein
MRVDMGAVLGYWLENVAWVVTMIPLREAHHAQVIVGTICAGDKLFDWQFCYGNQ